MIFLKSIQQVFGSSATQTLAPASTAEAPQVSITKKRQQALNQELRNAAASLRTRSEQGYTLEELIDWGAEVNAPDASGNTAIMLAVGNEKEAREYPSFAKQVMEELADADPDLTQAKDIAAGQLDPAMKELLDEIDTPEWRVGRLMEAAAAGKAKQTARLLRFGVDPNAIDEQGKTVLEHMIKRVDDYCARMKTPAAKKLRGYDPSGMFEETVRVLLSAGADITKGNGVALAQACSHPRMKTLLAEEIKKIQQQRVPVIAVAAAEEAARISQVASPAVLQANIRAPKLFVIKKPSNPAN